MKINAKFPMFSIAFSIIFIYIGLNALNKLVENSPNYGIKRIALIISVIFFGIILLLGLISSFKLILEKVRK